MPTKQDIETLAHQLWEEDGRPDGKAEEHWARAKSLLETGNDDPQSPVAPGESAAAAKPASKPRKTAARKTATTSKPASTPKTRTRKTG